eukprot:GHVL01022185.1.p1 GENE.GHVL01022185.1~~GHVL01022185.1.p1  ORF type:complete len:320 (+),score=27.82 GHVL01022185.1:95-961(+)
MKIGQHCGQQKLPFECTEKIKILGIYFVNNDRAINVEQNWVLRVQKIKKLIKIWSRRDLRIHGKIVIIKCFFISQLVFVMQTIGLPDRVLTELNRLFYKFIWQRKCSNKKAFEKVKIKVMEKEISEGGLKMLNVHRMQESFYLQWVGRLYEKKGENWTFIPLWFLGYVVSGYGCFDMNVKPSKELNLTMIGSPFWQRVVWTHLSYKLRMEHDKIDVNNFYEQILWSNDLIRHKGKMLFYFYWKNAGIERVSDLFIVEEKRLKSAAEVYIQTGKNNANILLDYWALINA